MSRYPEPRVVALTQADILALTTLDLVDIAHRAGTSSRNVQALLRDYSRAGSEMTPADERAAVLVIYGMAFTLERRLRPSLTWEEALTWQPRLAVDDGAEELVMDAARAEVEASLVSGAPVVATAGELTLAHQAAFGIVRGEQAAVLEAAARGNSRGAPRRRR